MDDHLPAMQAFQIQRKVTAASGFAELGLYQEAVEELEDLPESSRDDIPVLATWLQVYQSWRKWAEAAAVAERLIQKEPAEADWYIALSFAVRRAQSLAAAEVILSAALQKFPVNATIHFNLACYYTQLGDLDKARRYLQRATAIDDSFKKVALTDPDLQALRE
ncbi:MAG TPA: tetratricopeptide repeat protein [Chthoniobacterales bacterium]|nr:tetratricopeptide repeat protein [Chthoniobacterales bacterium]